jgi:aldose 1-epimerase
MTSSVAGAPFGSMPDGSTVDSFLLDSGSGLRVRVLAYGGIIQSIEAPDRAGRPGNVVLGFPDLSSYLRPNPFIGALIGRYANRIGGAGFTLDGVRHVLARNEGGNTLHGGPQGLDKKLWKADICGSGVAVRLQTDSPGGDQGFPGRLETSVTYSVTAGNELSIEYEAVTDAATVVNLTNHSYFNLAGGGDVLQHVVQLNADSYTTVDTGLIPDGRIVPVSGTPFDFTSPVPIGKRINDRDGQLVAGGGYDHNFVLRPGDSSTVAARIWEPASGRILECMTTEPGVQFYSGNMLDGSLHGSGGSAYRKHAGFCLETQHFPDSPNQPHFPSTVLRPGERFRSTTVYRFLTDATDHEPALGRS